MKRAAILAFAILSGCSLYSHSSGGDDVCNGGGVDTPVATDYVRDPTTGICNYEDYGGGGCAPDPDNNSCGCTATGGIAEPAGPSCEGPCENLDESDCVATAGCHAEYQESLDAMGVPPPTGTVDNQGNPTTFVSCWDIQPETPIEGGDCTQLDPYTCAQHDDCVSIMDSITDESTGAVAGDFAQCSPENGTTPPDVCGGVDCGSGAACETQCTGCDPTNGPGGCMSSCTAMCVPDQTCESIDCGPGYTCAESCEANAGSDSGDSGVCFPACYPTGPTDPGSCTGTVSCNDAPPTCPTNTTAGIEDGCYTGFCIPKTECGPSNPGSCDPSGVSCNIAAPKCPMGTVPGVSNGCWSGFCIPEASCPVAACETLTTEAACDARSDCESVFNGSSCVCTPDGTCTCGSQSWARCESAEDDFPPPVPQPGPVMPAVVAHH